MAQPDEMPQVKGIIGSMASNHAKGAVEAETIMETFVVRLRAVAGRIASATDDVDHFNNRVLGPLPQESRVNGEKDQPDGLMSQLDNVLDRLSHEATDLEEHVRRLNTIA